MMMYGMPEVKYRVGMNFQGEVVWCFMGLGNEPRSRFASRREGAKYAKEKLRRRIRREDNTFDALFEDRDVKVDEKGKGMFGHFEVRKDLSFMDGS
jgi:hypothetical protein